MLFRHKGLSAVQLAAKMSVNDIRKVWKQWTCTLNTVAMENSIESLRNVCRMGFQAIAESDQNLDLAHDLFLGLYNDLFTVNLDVRTRYNIANSMDLSIYYFEESKRKSAKKIKIDDVN
jgi:hypothetical protein